MLDTQRRAWPVPPAGVTPTSGELTRALALFVESFAFLQKWGAPSPLGIVSGLAGFAALALGQGQWARAARLYGAAETVRATSGVGLAPIAGTECQRNLDTLRHRLDPTTFAAAWAEGRAMTRDIALAYALEMALYAQDPPPPAPGPLTSREQEILSLIATGLSNQEIAQHLCMTIGTIKWYTGQIYSKLQVRGRTQAIARARALGWLA